MRIAIGDVRRPCKLEQTEAAELKHVLSLVRKYTKKTQSIEQAGQRRATAESIVCSRRERPKWKGNWRRSNNPLVVSELVRAWTEVFSERCPRKRTCNMSLKHDDVPAISRKNVDLNTVYFTVSQIYHIRCCGVRGLFGKLQMLCARSLVCSRSHWHTLGRCWCSTYALWLQQLTAWMCLVAVINNYFTDSIRIFFLLVVCVPQFAQL